MPSSADFLNRVIVYTEARKVECAIPVPDKLQCTSCQFFHRPVKAKNNIKCADNLYRMPEASLTVLDFTISVYGSSCNSLFFGVILASFLSLSTYWHPQGWMECRGIDRERKEGIMRPKKR